MKKYKNKKGSYLYYLTSLTKPHFTSVPYYPLNPFVFPSINH